VQSYSQHLNAVRSSAGPVPGEFRTARSIGDGSACELRLLPFQFTATPRVVS